ncbi:MAG TPA: AraC family transcriptional regulator [Steroidobacteraceae bacterium]|jgi:AraC family transcriptional regulator|nr:AraC family transcriptional regulator [Steroidobacteraceae bacterium]
MHCSDSQAGSVAASVLDVHSSPMLPRNIVDDEPEWRVLRQSSAAALSASRVVATRWHAGSERTLEFGAETIADCHVVKIVLRTMNIRFSVSGRIVHNGVTTPGTVHVTEPAALVRCLFRGQFDVLHLHVPNLLIAECARDMPGHHAPVLRSEAVPRKDILLDWLGRALLEANRVGGSFGQTYADCISMAIVARLLASASDVNTRERSRGSKLAQWRLKRAIDYVEARLDESVSLADVASSAGLTRMHFAAQFRAATGLRPHEYLLRRRIERAQEMLLGTAMSLVEVALSVGFQTQAHFTSVFKRYAGQPPRAWRESRGIHIGPTAISHVAERG